MRDAIQEEWLVVKPPKTLSFPYRSSIRSSNSNGRGLADKGKRSTVTFSLNSILRGVCGSRFADEMRGWYIGMEYVVAVLNYDI